MPCNKRPRMDECDAPSSKRTRKEYQVLDNIGYVEDRCHSMFRELPSQIEDASELIGKCIVSMLNTAGGIVAFGVRATGIIYGEIISRKEEDILRCTIDEAIKRINPCIRCDQYLVKFTPVKGEHFMDASKLPRQVLEIKVAQDFYELYEDQNHKAFSRDGASIIGPLTPHQIKRITIERLKNKIRSDKDRADLLSPRPIHRSALLCDNYSIKAVGSGMTRSSKNLASNSSGVVEITSIKGMAKKASNSSDVVEITSIKGLAKKASNSKDVMELRSSKDLAKKASNSSDVMELRSSKDLAKKASNSSDVMELRSSKDLAKKASNSSDVMELRSSKNLAKKASSISSYVVKIKRSKDLAKKASNSKDVVEIRSNKDVAKKASNSNDVVEIRSNKDLAKKASNSNDVVEIQSNKDLAKKASNSKDVMEITSNKDLAEKASNSKDVAILIKSSKGTSVKSGSFVERSLPAKGMLSTVQKENYKKNVSSAFSKKVSSTMANLKTLSFLPSLKPCSHPLPKIGRYGPITTVTALRNINTNSTSIGRLPVAQAHSLLPTHKFLPLPPRMPHGHPYYRHNFFPTFQRY